MAIEVLNPMLDFHLVNQLNKLVSEIGLLQALKEIQKQAMHFSDFERDHGDNVQAKRWSQFYSELGLVIMGVESRGLNWPVERKEV